MHDHLEMLREHGAQKAALSIYRHMSHFLLQSIADDLETDVNRNYRRHRAGQAKRSAPYEQRVDEE